jgi:hypothetical protein
MKCGYPALNAQGSRLIVVVPVPVRGSEIICSNSGGAQEEGKDRMKLSLPPNFMGLLTIGYWL